jgi:toxin ParE1/3/4
LRIRITRPALDDLKATFSFIGADSLRAAVDVLDRLTEAIQGLNAMPDRGRIGRIADTRELIVRTGHVVIYRIQGDEVVVLHVRHGKQKWPPG